MSSAPPRRVLRARVRVGWLAGAIAVVLLVVLFATPAGADGARLAARLVDALRHGGDRGRPALMVNARPTIGTAAVGALFNLTSSGALHSHFCSASVVDSRAGNLVLTAAHCLTGRSADQFVFVPGYHDGSAPYGIWTVTRIITDQDWESSADPDDDFAFLEVTQAGNLHTVQQVTGGERLGVVQSVGQLATVVGYPDNSNSAIVCVQDIKAFSPTQLEFDCGGFTTGTSGSPLVVHVDPATGLGEVVGVIGGYQQGGDTPSISYAASFGQNFAELYQLASTGS
jgi:V8-like Glu-specific endopeptidase